MEDAVKGKESKKQYVTLVIVVVLVLVGACILLGYNLSEITKDKNIFKSTADKIKSQLTEKTIEAEGFAKQIDLCNDELSKLKTRMEGIKNADDLLKRDIFLYIDKKFQIIPRTVAVDIAEQVLRLSKQHEVSPELVVGIIQVESAFNPMAISKANARGLMQVMPEWAPKFGLKKVSDLHDIDTGIECGIKVLKIHIEEGKGNISKGLYYYVGKDDKYSSKVYESMGKFVAFRSTVDDDEVDIDLNGNGKEKEDEEKVDADKPKQ